MNIQSKFSKLAAVSLVLVLFKPLMYAPVTGGEDPLVSFYFSLDADGVLTGFFTEMSDIGSENTIIEHRIVNEAGQEVTLKLPGRLKYNNVTLKRGITSNMDAWTWRKMVEDGNFTEAKVNASLVMYDQNGASVAQWDLESCWPASVRLVHDAVTGATFEELVLVYEAYQRFQ